TRRTRSATSCTARRRGTSAPSWRLPRAPRSRRSPGRPGRHAGPGGGSHPEHLRRPDRPGRGPSIHRPGSPLMSEPTVEHTDRGPLTTDELAAVIGHDIPAGSYVNLGIGQPTKIADYLPTDDGGNQTVILHTENGMLGMGPTAAGDQIDPDLTNAGKVPVTELPGAAYFHHADSFAMMRGGHLDVCVLGAYQVSAA